MAVKRLTEKSDGLPRVRRHLDGSMSFRMSAHGCVECCPCQLRPGESQPSIASMEDYDAYAAVYPRNDGESSYEWQKRVIREGRRFDRDPGPGAPSE